MSSNKRERRYEEDEVNHVTASLCHCCVDLPLTKPPPAPSQEASSKRHRTDSPPDLFAAIKAGDKEQVNLALSADGGTTVQQRRAANSTTTIETGEFGNEKGQTATSSCKPCSACSRCALPYP